MNFQNLLSRRKILSKVFNSHMVCYIAINTFVNFEISGAFFNPSLNTLRLINEFEKCIPSFLEDLIANFIQFSSAIAKFLFLKGRLDYVYETICALSFVILLHFSHIVCRLTICDVTRSFSL